MEVTVGNYSTVKDPVTGKHSTTLTFFSDENFVQFIATLVPDEKSPVEEGEVILESSPSYYDTVVSSPGLTTYWRFDGEGYEFSDLIKGKTAEVIGEITTGSPSLINDNEDQAITLPGTKGNYVRAYTPYQDMNLGLGFTLECWIHPLPHPEPGQRQQLVYKSGAEEVDACLFLDEQMRPVVRFRDEFGAYHNAYSKTPLEPHRTYHIVGTYHAELQPLSVFVDGVQGEVQASPGGGVYQEAGNLGIGSTDVGEERFCGVMDEVSYYVINMPPRQVEQHYTAGLGLGKGGTPYKFMIPTSFLQEVAQESGSTILKVFAQSIDGTWSK